jgi:hypothetical protein
VSCNRRPILEKHLNHSYLNQVRQTLQVLQWIARKKKQDHRSYSSSDLFGYLSLVDNTDVGNGSTFFGAFHHHDHHYYSYFGYPYDR